jgi:hypothetical protein
MDLLMGTLQWAAKDCMTVVDPFTGGRAALSGSRGNFNEGDGVLVGYTSTTPGSAIPNPLPGDSEDTVVIGTISAWPGSFFLQTVMSSTKTLVADILYANVNPGAGVAISDKKSTTTANQMWSLVPSETVPYFFVVSAFNGLLLTAKGLGSQVIMGALNPGAPSTQRWSLLADSDGSVFVAMESAEATPLVLDAKGATPTPGAAIILNARKSSGTENQRWKVVAGTPN